MCRRGTFVCSCCAMLGKLLPFLATSLSSGFYLLYLFEFNLPKLPVFMLTDGHEWSVVCSSTVLPCVNIWSRSGCSKILILMLHQTLGLPQHRPECVSLGQVLPLKYFQLTDVSNVLFVEFCLFFFLDICLGQRVATLDGLPQNYLY